MNVQVNAAFAGLRAALDAYREQIVLGNAEPRFRAALERAGPVEGFTTPGELSLLYHLAVAADGPGRIVEIGSYLGRSTIVLAAAVADTNREPVVAIDPHTAALMIEGLPPRDTRNEFLANLRPPACASTSSSSATTPCAPPPTTTARRSACTSSTAGTRREAVLEDVGEWAQWFTPDASPCSTTT